MKRNRKTKKNRKLERRPEVWLTVWGVILLGLGLTLLVTLIQPQGAIGDNLRTGLSVLFGMGSVVVPFFVMGAGIVLLRRTEHGLWLTLGLYTLLFLLVLGMLHLVGDADLSWAAVSAGNGGGFFGFVVAGSVAWIFGPWGAGVLLFTLFVALLLILFDISFSVEPLWQKLPSLSQLRNARSTQTEPQPSAPEPNASVSEPSETEPAETHTYDPPPQTETEPTSSGPETDHPESTGFDVTFPNYNGPSLDLLEKTKPSDAPDSGNVEENKQKIQSTLRNFGIEVEMGEVHQGPTVTRYLLRPVNAVKLSRITALQDNIKLALEGGDIRMKAPVPGYSFVGIEVPNAKRAVLRLRGLLESDAYQDDSHDLPLVLGKNIMNEPVVEGLEKMPHLLIGGTTGSGKSMQLHSMILSLLYRNSPEDLRFIFVDPKHVELSQYNNIPHLLTPVIDEQEKVVNALNWCVQEMNRRYQIVKQAKCTGISQYNEYVKSGRSVQTPEGEEEYEPFPYIVVVVDELAELMLKGKKEIEPPIANLAAKARAVGIHLILATQKPSVDVVTGLIKANFPARIGLKVPSNPDSRTILDKVGAEALLGNGDMLFRGSDDPHLQRVQGAYVSEQEITDVIAAVKESGAPAFNPNVVESSQPGGGRGLAGSEGGSEDPLFEEAKEVVVNKQKGSATYLQKRLKVGFARASNLLEDLEEEGVVGPEKGTKPREVLQRSVEEDV